MRLFQSVMALFVCVCCLFLESCHFFNGANGDVERITGEIVETRTKIMTASGEWQFQLDHLKDELRRDTSDTARQALDGINETAQRTVQAAGGEMRCTGASLKHVAMQNLTNVIHKIRHEQLADMEPDICTFSPPTLDLSADQVRTLNVSGTFFYAARKPKVIVKSRPDQSKLVPEDLIARQTDYMLVLNIDEAMKRKIITEDSTSLELSFPSADANIVHQVLIQGTPQCDDGVPNGTGEYRETDTDCGGSLCAKCSVGKMCKHDSDCATNACVSGRCAAHQLVGPNFEQVFGGNGLGNGDNFASCPANYLAAGFKAYTGNWFDRFAVKCAVFNADGTVGPDRKESDMIGNLGGNAMNDSDCSEGRVLYGIKGKVYDGPSAVQGLCALPSEIAKKPQLLTTKQETAMIAPSGRGGWATAECPAGYAIVGLHVHWVDLVSKLSVECQSVSRGAPTPPAK